MDNNTESEAHFYPGLASPAGNSFSDWASWLRDRGQQFDPYVQGPAFDRLADWMEHLGSPSVASEAAVFGYWCKFADGSEEFRFRLPTDPDCEDMASSYVTLYKR